MLVCIHITRITSIYTKALTQINKVNVGLLSAKNIVLLKKDKQNFGQFKQ